MIKDHYVLEEDLNEVSNELMKLHACAMSAIRIATNAKFHEREELLQNINRSMKVLQVYNEKKLKRDANIMANAHLEWRR